MALTKTTLTGTVDTIKQGWTKFNDLIDDLLSTSNGLGASQVGIEDSAGNMAAANVETALAEIYTDVASAQAVANTLDENSATTTGLTWGFLAGAVRVNNVITAVSAGTIGLTDDATNYVEVTQAGVVTKNTSAFTFGSIPIRQVVCASGSQSTSTDKRVFLAPSVLTPAGAVLAFAFDSPPSGWLECDGSTINRTTYADLFSAIGTVHGVGNGSTTFEIPTYQGQFLRGWDNSAGVDPDAGSRTDAGDGSTTGDNVGTKQITATIAPTSAFTVSDPGTHTHTGPRGTTVGAGAYITGAIVFAANSITTGAGGAHVHTVTGGDNESRPLNVNVMYCIKY